METRRRSILLVNVGCLTLILALAIGGWLIWNPQLFYSPVTLQGVIVERDSGKSVKDAEMLFRIYGRRGPRIPFAAGPLSEGHEKIIRADEAGRFSISFKDDFIELVEITAAGKLVPDFTAIFQRFDGVEYVTEGYLDDRGNCLYPKAPEPSARDYVIKIDKTERAERPERKSYFRNHRKGAEETDEHSARTP